MSDRLPLPPLSSIRVFEAAGRLKSFTRAAEELGMTQAAVSYQVKALEDRLGAQMFRRLPREVALTPEGERLLRAASESMHLLRTAVADITETAAGVLAVTCFPTLATTWLVGRLGGFHLKHPGIAVRLETSNRLVDLAHEQADVALRAGSGEWPGLEARRLMTSLHTPLCTPGQLEALGGLADPADLLRAPLIGDMADWALWFREAGVGGDTRERTSFAADNQPLEVASALAGAGVALGSPILFAQEIAAGRLVQPFSVVVDTGRSYWVAYPEERRRSPKIRAFADWITAEAAADPAVQRYAGPDG